MSPKIKIKKQAGISIVKISGEFTSQKTPELSKKLQAFIEGDQRFLAIDMSEADYLDSYCLGVFVYTWKIMREQGQELLILSPSEFVENLLSETKLSQVIRVVTTLEGIDQ